ncbi:hypothetical protein SAMD00019534_032300, partial [Acytostelium subglobosum LB1]|uniref:hypothetical protein n=1 Tax=Acytostelium subglobosum LB1 TaxID=1410327 RepID=UPI000644EBDE
ERQIRSPLRNRHQRTAKEVWTWQIWLGKGRRDIQRARFGQGGRDQQAREVNLLHIHPPQQ